MSETLTDPPPIACTLDAGDLRERLALIAELNASALRGSRRDDLQLTLTYASQALDRVQDLVAREQACCAFLTFILEPGPREVRLTIAAPEAARQALDSVFAPFTATKPATAACGCCPGAAA